MGVDVAVKQKVLWPHESILGGGGDASAYYL